MIFDHIIFDNGNSILWLSIQADFGIATVIFSENGVETLEGGGNPSADEGW